MATATKARTAQELPEPLYRISLDLYRKMGDLGLLTERDRVVLLDGLLVGKMPKKPLHCASAEQTWAALMAILPVGWYARKEGVIELPGGPGRTDSAPEPDVAVVKGRAGSYKTRHPGPRDVGLIVEVALSSLKEDRRALARYAFASIPRVWIVNLIDRVVEVYESPTGPSPAPGYRRSRVYKPGDEIDLRLGRRLIGRIAVDQLLP